jgi:hypothetical protein
MATDERNLTMLLSVDLFSLIVKEVQLRSSLAIGLLGGGMPLFPTFNYSKSLVEPRVLNGIVLKVGLG